MLATRLEKQVSYLFFMQWSRLITMGLRPGDSFSMKGDRPAPWCANELVRIFLGGIHDRDGKKALCDSILFLDSDAQVTDDFISQFRDYKPGWKYDILQAFCTRRAWPPRPVWYSTHEPLMTDQVLTDPDLCEPVKAVGLHATLIKRHVFEKLMGGDGPLKHDWFYYPRAIDRSEDIAFSLDAAEAGFRMGATTAVRTGHLTYLSLGWDTYQEYLKTNHVAEAKDEIAMPA